jgi:hypothetical protein
MALFSFQSRFVAPILAGTKRQTIRARRKHLGAHGKVGGPISLVSGSRFKPRPLGASTCVAAGPISMDLVSGEVRMRAHQGFHRISATAALDQFAVGDGFEDWADLRGFWAKFHPGVTVFEGIITVWGDLA